MKMIRRTRTTSTSGVTFMSGTTTPPRPSRLGNPLTADLLPLRPGMLFPEVLDQVDQLARRRGERQLVARDAGREPVEREHGRDRDREAERRLDECLADAGGHGRQAAGAGRRDALERRDDAEHGAEEA